MRFFAVHFTHYDSDGWKQYLRPHLEYLQGLVERGMLRASGPLIGTPVRSGLLLMSGKTREDIVEAVNRDPLMIHGLVNVTRITEWDPVFGVFSAESSGQVETVMLAESTVDRPSDPRLPNEETQ